MLKLLKELRKLYLTHYSLWSFHFSIQVGLDKSAFFTYSFGKLLYLYGDPSISINKNKKAISSFLQKVEYKVGTSLSFQKTIKVSSNIKST